MDILNRFAALKNDARERCFRVTDDQLVQLLGITIIEERLVSLRSTLDVVADAISESAV